MPPRGVKKGTKRARQYEHIKKSEKEQGKSEARAEEIIEVETLDAIRVSPEVVRAFEADSEGIEVLAVGVRHDGDGEVIPGWWAD
jgi:hypothetical protein